MQVYDDNDLHEGQRSSEVECGKCCTLVTKLGQKESLMQVYDGDDLHEGQKSSEVKCGKLCTMVTKLGQQNRYMQVLNNDAWPSRLRHFNECFRLT